MFLFLLMVRAPPRFTLFPYTTLFRSMLAQSPRFRVWVVSGRRRADIRSRIKVPGIRYLGLHGWEGRPAPEIPEHTDRKSTRLNSSHANISYAVFCLKKKKREETK